MALVRGRWTISKIITWIYTLSEVISTKKKTKKQILWEEKAFEIFDSKPSKGLTVKSRLNKYIKDMRGQHMHYERPWGGSASAYFSKTNEVSVAEGTKWTNGYSERCLRSTREVWWRSCRALQVSKESFFFSQNKMGSHWRVLSRAVTWLDNLYLFTSVWTRVLILWMKMQYYHYFCGC